MNKPKISEILSYEYPHGRIDTLKVSFQLGIHKQIVELLNNIKFSKDELDKFDLDMKNFEGYIFGYSKKIKVHLFSSEEGICLVFDSKENKEMLIKEIEKYFQIF
jgi:hypothetical protein